MRLDLQPSLWRNRLSRKGISPSIQRREGDGERTERKESCYNKPAFKGYPKQSLRTRLRKALHKGFSNSVTFPFCRIAFFGFNKWTCLDKLLSYPWLWPCETLLSYLIEIEGSILATPKRDGTAALTLSSLANEAFKPSTEDPQSIAGNIHRPTIDLEAEKANLATLRQASSSTWYP